MSPKPHSPLIELHDAAVDPLWSGLNLTVQPGEWLTVLGPNGVGKSTLLGAITGTRRLTAGTVKVHGATGFIPQQQMFDPAIPMRARDLVALAGGHGILRKRTLPRKKVEAALETVGAMGLANRRIGQLSGGQQQLIRQAQALATDPDILLCDEPLLSLDYAAQKRIVDLIDLRRRDRDTAVIFVTHSINPVVEVTDRVLYIAPNGHQVGALKEVMRSEVLSRLYGTPVEVATVNGRMVVV